MVKLCLLTIYDIGGKVQVKQADLLCIKYGQSGHEIQTQFGHNLPLDLCPTHVVNHG